MQLAHRPLFFSFVLMLHREQIVRYCADFIVVLDNPTCNELPPLKDVDLAVTRFVSRSKSLSSYLSRVFSEEEYEEYLNGFPSLKYMGEQDKLHKVTDQRNNREVWCIVVEK